MHRFLTCHLVILAVNLTASGSGNAAPVRDEKQVEEEKSIKAVIAKFVNAMSEQDVDSFVEACGVPFSHEPGKLAEDTTTLRKMYKVEVEGRRPFEAHEVKLIETFASAKARLGGSKVKGFEEAIGEKDFVVLVETTRRGQKSQTLLLVKPVDGKPKIVGWRPNSGD